MHRTTIFILYSIRSKKSIMAKIFEYQNDELCIKYLGMPIFIGNIKAKYWGNLRNKIYSKLLG